MLALHIDFLSILFSRVLNVLKNKIRCRNVSSQDLILLKKFYWPLLANQAMTSPQVCVWGCSYICTGQSRSQTYQQQQCQRISHLGNEFFLFCSTDFIQLYTITPIELRAVSPYLKV